MIRRAASLALLCACAHARTPAQDAMMKRADCAELLKAADVARADGLPGLARDLAGACPADRLIALVDSSTPAQALLWCGRARAGIRRNRPIPTPSSARPSRSSAAS